MRYITRLFCFILTSRKGKKKTEPDFWWMGLNVILRGKANTEVGPDLW